MFREKRLLTFVIPPGLYCAANCEADQLGIHLSLISAVDLGAVLRFELDCSITMIGLISFLNAKDYDLATVLFAQTLELLQYFQRN